MGCAEVGKGQQLPLGVVQLSTAVGEGSCDRKEQEHLGVAHHTSFHQKCCNVSMGMRGVTVDCHHFMRYFGQLIVANYAFLLLLFIVFVWQNNGGNQTKARPYNKGRACRSSSQHTDRLISVAYAQAQLQQSSIILLQVFTPYQLHWLSQRE